MRIQRYSAVAMLLHWLTALAILAMIPMGWWMSQAINEPQNQALAYRVFQLHKSIGFTILALTLVRIGWRIAHRPPPMPSDMKWWEAFLARATQFAFYGLLLALPLTGWLYVSTGWSAGLDRALNVATSWFGLFGVPHIPGVEALSAASRRVLAFQAMGAHSLLAWGAVVLVALHIGATLKHHFINRDTVLKHMLPGRAAPRPEKALLGSRRRGWVSAVAGAVGIVVIASVGWTLAGPTSGSTSGAPAETAAETHPAATEAAITPGAAQAWTLDKAASSIRFSGTHAGAAFNGRFDDWEGHIWFDPADLAGSKAVVIVRTSSARTGDATQEGSLGDAEWFNPKIFPSARFETTSFRPLGGDRYEAEGALRIKDRTVPLTLPFTLKQADGVTTVEGTLTLDRTVYDLGMASDATGDWVSKAIVLKVSVKASKAG